MTSAAGTLHVSQSALSRQLSDLEKEPGHTLFKQASGIRRRERSCSLHTVFASRHHVSLHYMEYGSGIMSSQKPHLCFLSVSALLLPHCKIDKSTHSPGEILHLAYSDAQPAHKRCTKRNRRNRKRRSLQDQPWKNRRPQAAFHHDHNGEVFLDNISNFGMKIRLQKSLADHCFIITFRQNQRAFRKMPSRLRRDVPINMHILGITFCNPVNANKKST